MSLPFKFSTPVKVRFNETDLQGHVNFGHHLFYFDVGLTEYMDAIGYSYARMLEEGADMVYVEAHCRYRSPMPMGQAPRAGSAISCAASWAGC